MVSDLETAKDKLQASQRYTDELERTILKVEAERDDYKAERDDCQRKSSEANEWIMQHLNTQV